MKLPPIPEPRQTGKGSLRPRAWWCSPTSISAPSPQQRPRLPRSSYPAIAERARYESLRDLADEYGVSHETIRAIVRRAGAAAQASALAAD